MDARGRRGRGRAGNEAEKLADISSWKATRLPHQSVLALSVALTLVSLSLTKHHRKLGGPLRPVSGRGERWKRGRAGNAMPLSLRFKREGERETKNERRRSASDEEAKNNTLAVFQSREKQTRALSPSAQFYFLFLTHT